MYVYEYVNMYLFAWNAYIYTYINMYIYTYMHIRWTISEGGQKGGPPGGRVAKQQLHT